MSDLEDGDYVWIRVRIYHAGTDVSLVEMGVEKAPPHGVISAVVRNVNIASARAVSASTEQENSDG